MKFLLPNQNWALDALVEMGGLVCCLCVLQWDGGLSIWDSPTTLILSQEGVVGPMGRNGGAQEMQLPIRSTVSGT